VQAGDLHQIALRRACGKVTAAAQEMRGRSLHAFLEDIAGEQLVLVVEDRVEGCGEAIGRAPHGNRPELLARDEECAVACALDRHQSVAPELVMLTASTEVVFAMPMKQAYSPAPMSAAGQRPPGVSDRK